MAYYSYKIVRDLIPEDFQEAYQKYNDEVFYAGNSQYSYDGNPAYDGDFYCMIATYIKWLTVKQDDYADYNMFFKMHGEF